MRGSPEFKRSRMESKKMNDINAYKASKLLSKNKRAGSSLASYQGREMMKKASFTKTNSKLRSAGITTNQS